MSDRKEGLSPEHQLSEAQTVRQAQKMTRSTLKTTSLRPSGVEDCNPAEIIAIVLQRFLTNQVQVLEKRGRTDEVEKLRARKLYAPHVEGLEVMGEA